MRDNAKNAVNAIYSTLNGYFGDLKWWPAESDFEVIVGAVLAQNTAWGNVEKAIKRLKANKLIDPRRILETPSEKLAKCVRASGFYKIKAQRLKEITNFIINECGGNLELLKCKDTDVLRKKLLQVNGIGPETADAVLLYALGKPVFIASEYARRIFSRHDLVGESISYDDLQAFIQKNFSNNKKKLNQFHAVLVETGKNFCGKKKTLCAECPLGV